MNANEASGAVWIFRSLLAAGVGLTGLGLARDTRRYRQWKQVRDRHDGEIVPAENALRAGQSVVIVPEAAAGENFDARATAGVPVVNGRRATGTLAEVTEKTLRIALEAEVGATTGGAWPANGERVVVTVTSETALYCFTAKVRVAGGRENMPAVARPLWLARIQRRNYVRAPVQAEATFEETGALVVMPGSATPRPQTFSRQSTVLPLTGEVVNLSGGGVCAEMTTALSPSEAAALTERLTPGTVLSVRLALPALRETHLLARIRSGERTAKRGGLGLRLACEFLPMPSWERELLIRHVFSAMRERAAAR